MGGTTPMCIQIALRTQWIMKRGQEVVMGSWKGCLGGLEKKWGELYDQSTLHTYMKYSENE